MFGKKKDKPIPVVHYEGLDFAVNYPCQIALENDIFTIKRIKPETVVTLPISRIKSFSAMTEPEFMLKYHGEAINTSKAKGIDKYYLVIHYTDKSGVDKFIDLWGTASEYGRFIDFTTYPLNTLTHVEL